MPLRLITDREVEARGIPPCSLSAWDGDDGHCRWCGSPVRNSGLWCSLACEDLYEAEHEWGRAYATALARDRERCRDCGSGSATAREARAFLSVVIPLDPVRAAEVWRSEEWLALQLACSVDVVHRMPTGQSYRSGCHNHIEGLVTMCRRCLDRAKIRGDRRAG